MRWTAAFSHVSRRSLRGERELPELLPLLRDPDAVERISRAQHMPSFVAQILAGLLREAVEQGDLDRVAFLAVDRERAQLIDHVGGCERILRTPLPQVHTSKLRRFIVLYLLALPIAVVGTWWFPGLVTVLVAYPLLAIDQIAAELENPFSLRNLSHLPLNPFATPSRATCSRCSRPRRPSRCHRPGAPCPTSPSPGTRMDDRGRAVLRHSGNAPVGGRAAIRHGHGSGRWDRGRRTRPTVLHL